MGGISQDWDFHAMMSPMPPTLKGHYFFSRNIRIMNFCVCFLHLYASNLSYLEALYYFFFKSENKLENQIFLEYFFHQFFYDF